MGKVRIGFRACAQLKYSGGGNETDGALGSGDADAASADVKSTSNRNELAGAISTLLLNAPTLAAASLGRSGAADGLLQLDIAAHTHAMDAELTIVAADKFK